MFRADPACSWRNAAAAILFFVLAGASVDELRVDAFASTASSAIVMPSGASGLPTGSRPATSSASPSMRSPSRLQFFSGFEMGGFDDAAAAATTKNKKDKNNDVKGKDKDKVTDGTNGQSLFIGETEDPLFYAELVTKMVIILIIKTAKDIINYPPNLLDQYNRSQQIRNREIAADLKTEDAAPATLMLAEEVAQESTTIAVAPTRDASSDTSNPLPLELTRTNPFILLAKLLGVLAYKSLHDSIYYPALWINDTLYPPRNDDNYYYY